MSSTQFAFILGGGFEVVEGHIQSIQLVPEPSLLALLSAGLLALLGFRRRA